MTYTLGDGDLWNSCWELLEDEEKIEARATMRREALASHEKGRDLSEAEITERAAKMVLGPGGNLLYTFGHDNTYYDIWDILSDEEQHEARLQIQTSSFTTRGAGSLTTTESVRLTAQYICTEKLNVDPSAAGMEAPLQVRTTKSIRRERMREGTVST